MKSKTIIVNVEVPDIDICHSYHGDDYCSFFFDGYCYLFNDFPHADKTEDVFIKLDKCKAAVELRKGCINCGYYNDNWCELNKKKVLSSDSCSDFEYGSWK
jgi:hypothetical protein